MVTAELLSIGDELLIGQVINTNAAYIADALGSIGIYVHRVTTVGDNEKGLRQAIRRAWSESGVVIATGGLGPTHDDISKRVVAKFFGKKLHFDRATLRQVQARFRPLGYKTMPEGNEGQAMIPDGFEALRNEKGTAPGLLYHHNQRTFIILPGVPQEMEWLMTKWVVPKLRTFYKTTGVILHRTLQTTGIGESVLANTIGDVKEFLEEGVTLAFLPRIGGVRLRLTVRAKTGAEANRKLDKAARYIYSKAGHSIFGEADTTLEEAVVSLLRKRHATIATAESCTGGMLAARLTNVAGASDVYPGSIVAYANAVKVHELGVSRTLLDRHGAVSEEVVTAMAEGARKKFDTTFGLAITGIAGPSGGTPEKPVGMVWIAIAEQGKVSEAMLLHNLGDRRTIRERSAEFALEFLRQRLITVDSR